MRVEGHSQPHYNFSSLQVKTKVDPRLLFRTGTNWQLFQYKLTASENQNRSAIAVINRGPTEVRNALMEAWGVGKLKSSRSRGQDLWSQAVVASAIM